MREYRVVKSVDIENAYGDIYCVFFEREFEEYWGYMGMRDYRTYEPTDEFRLVVVRYRNGSASNVMRDNDSIVTVNFDKEMANRIYLTLENGMHYEGLCKALAKNGIERIRRY